MTPAVSIILTTFNGATRGYLREAISSALAQSDPDYELLIVDDGSTDDTMNRSKPYINDPRIRYIRKANGGAASARNRGIEEARADLICFLDDDDVWTPDKLARQRKIFAEHSPRPGLVYSAIAVTDSGGRIRNVQYHPVPPDPYRTLFYENVVDATSTVMISAEAIREVGKFREDIFTRNLQGAEDRELWSRIARKYRLVSIEEPLVRYRMHPVKLSTTHDNMEQSERAMLDLALSTAPADVIAQKSDIYHAAYSRFAHNRFSLGDYSGFRRHFRMAGSFARVTPGLWVRYILSSVPFAVTMLRRLGVGVSL